MDEWVNLVLSSVNQVKQEAWTRDSNSKKSDVVITRWLGVSVSSYANVI